MTLQGTGSVRSSYRSREKGTVGYRGVDLGSTALPDGAVPEPTIKQ